MELFSIEECTATDEPWVVRNPVTGTVHYLSDDWSACDAWVTMHTDTRYVVVERKSDYRPFDEYVRLGLLRNAPTKTRSQTEQLVLI